MKVCATVTSSCSGIALIQGMEWTVDPNGDGSFNDRMHLINMSLGSNYGQPFDDDLSLAVENATDVGHSHRRIVGEQFRQAVCDGYAGCGGLGALGRADRCAERVPAAHADPRAAEHRRQRPGRVPAMVEAAHGPDAGVGAVRQRRRRQPERLHVVPGRFAHREDRARRSRHLRLHAQDQQHRRRRRAGRDHRPHRAGRPVRGWRRGRRSSPDPGLHDQPGELEPTQVAGSRTRSSGSTRLSACRCRGSIVGSSSRGPQHESTQRDQAGDRSARRVGLGDRGHGTGTEPFGGTSGAAPMVAGSAALLLEAPRRSQDDDPKGPPPGNAFGHGLSPLEVKALLMNNAETNIIDDALLGALTPITRIGGGEVRVEPGARRARRCVGQATRRPVRSASDSSTSPTRASRSTKTVRHPELRQAEHHARTR